MNLLDYGRGAVLGLSHLAMRAQFSLFSYIVEAHCYDVTVGEYILMSKYVAESINQHSE